MPRCPDRLPSEICGKGRDVRSARGRNTSDNGHHLIAPTGVRHPVTAAATTRVAAAPTRRSSAGCSRRQRDPVAAPAREVTGTLPRRRSPDRRSSTSRCGSARRRRHVSSCSSPRVALRRGVDDLSDRVVGVVDPTMSVENRWPDKGSVSPGRPRQSRRAPGGGCARRCIECDGRRVTPSLDRNPRTAPRRSGAAPPGRPMLGAGKLRTRSVLSSAVGDTRWPPGMPVR